MLSLDWILRSADIRSDEAMVIRHAYVREHEDSGLQGIHADSTDDEILYYTSRQSATQRVFPVTPPQYWIVFIREDGGRARFWAVVENHGEAWNDGRQRAFTLTVSKQMDDLRNRLVIGWKSPRAWWINGVTAAPYPVLEIADSQPIPFPGFDVLVLDHPQLQAVMRDHRYASWRTALASVKGIYLITDTRDGRHYVGKADGSESIRQRWAVYATNGHGGNVELRNLEPSTFRYSILRVFDPATPERDVNEAEDHYKRALDSRRWGLNRN